jgi:hypothetical protein
MEIRKPVVRKNACQVHQVVRKGVLAALLCLFAALPVWAQSVPEFFGIYAKVDGKLASMIGGKGNFTPNESSYQVIDYYSGESGTQNALIFEGRDLSFLVFDAAVADLSSTVELYKVPFARSVITHPDAVGGLLGQITRSPQGNSTSYIERYLVAKTEGLKIDLLEKPVAGQPQMLELVPASNLTPGIYGLFAIKNQGGQTMINYELFEWRGAPGSTQMQFCIDMQQTGGFGGLVENHDARLEHPYFLSKDNYALCSADEASAQAPNASSTAASSAKSNGGAFVPPANLPQTTCSAGTFADYMINLNNHLYRVQSSGPAIGANRKLSFFDLGRTQVTDPALLAQLADAVWTHDNVIASSDARTGSTRVADILGTSKALQNYTTTQDILARAMVEAVEAGLTDGTSLSTAVQHVTVGVLKTQIKSLPKTLLTHTAQIGLAQSEADYKQLEADLPPTGATVFNATSLAQIHTLYVQARSLELAYSVLAAKLMPTTGKELSEQALKSALSELTVGPASTASPTAAVTLKDLLNLQTSIANLTKALPAMQAYSQNLALASNLKTAESKEIAGWASSAVQVCQ